MADRSMSQFLFGSNEHPNRQKMNDMVNVIDQTRRFTGSVSISLIDSGHTASGVYVRLAESPYTLGGVYYDAAVSSWVSRNYFWFGYDNTVWSGYHLLNSGDTPDYAAWKCVQFISGGSAGVSGYWYTHLTNSGDMVYGTMYVSGVTLGSGAGEINISGVGISSFTCMNSGPYSCAS